MKRVLSKSAQKELRLLALIHGNQNVSRVELAKMTGASVASMTALVQRLIRTGLVVESGRSSSALGRKPVFNHTNFQLPQGDIINSSFGFVTSANDPRIGQLAIKFLF